MSACERIKRPRLELAEACTSTNARGAKIAEDEIAELERDTEDESSSSDSDSEEEDEEKVASWRKHPNFGEAKWLHRLLRKADDYLGNSFFHDALSSVPNPGLTVANVGSVNIPIGLDDGEKLYAHARDTAPLDGTVVEIGASQLEFRNPAWSKWIDGTLAERVGRELGVDEGARPQLELAGMKVYQSGGKDVEFNRPPKGAAGSKIGYVELTLPGDFEGGSVFLSDGNNKKTIDLRRGCPFDVVVAGWDRSVLHRSARVFRGHKVTLIYRISTKYSYTHPTPASRATRSEALLDALSEVKKSNAPVAYVLKGDYSLSALRDGTFVSVDHFAVQNLIRAVDIVGGIALYCGDLVTRDTSEADDGFDLPEDEIQIELLDDLDYENNNVHFIKHKLDNMTKLAGVTRAFDRDEEWDGPILTFGSKLADLEPFDTTREEGLENWFRSPCIVLWPTSAVQSLKGQARHAKPVWKNILETIKSTPPKPSEAQYHGKSTINIVVDACVRGNFSEGDIQEAASLLEETFAKLSSKSQDTILQMYSKNRNPLFGEDYDMNLPTSEGGVWGHVLIASFGRKWSKVARKASLPLERQLKMMELFPDWMRGYLLPILEKIIQTRSYLANMEPDAVRSIFDVLSWQSQDLLTKYLRLMFMANPSENFRRMVDEDMKTNLAQAPVELRTWASMSRRCHEYIIEGLKKSSRHSVACFCPGFMDIVGYEPEPGLDLIKKKKEATQLSNYLRLLQDEPDSVSLTERLLDAISTPSPSRPQIYSEFLFPIAVEVHRLQSSSEIAKEKPAVLDKFMKLFQQTVLKDHPCKTPAPGEMPDLSLPPLVTGGQGCTKDPQCSLCVILDKFLGSATEEKLRVGMSRYREHVRYIWEALQMYATKHPVKFDPSEMIHPDGEQLCVIELTKNLATEHNDAKERFNRGLAGRKRMLCAVGLKIGDAGEILGEPSEQKIIMSEPKRVKLSLLQRAQLRPDDPDEELEDAGENEGKQQPTKASKKHNQLNNANGEAGSDASDDNPFIAGLGDFDPNAGDWWRPRLSEYRNYEISKTLHGILKNSNTYLGNFAFTHTYPEGPSPGLLVANVGSIGIPISSNDGERLYAHGCSLATPTSAQNGIAEIPGANLEFKNPAWGAWLEGVMYKVELELGIGDEDSLKVKLEKLVISSSGGTDEGFTTNCSTQNTPVGDKILGYLEVTLPGEFTGGSVSLSCNPADPAVEGEKKIPNDSTSRTETKTIDFRGDCNFNLTATAWYSDVEHRTAKITKGYKTTLIYSLYMMLPPKTPTSRFSQSSALATALRALPNLTDRSKRELHSADEYDPIVYVLADDYHDQKYPPNRDKVFLPKDRIIMQNLIHAISNVPGLSLYTGDLVTKDPYGRDQPTSKRKWRTFGRGNKSKSPAPPNDLDFEDNHREDLTHKLSRMAHLAGPVRRLSELYWQGPIMTFGPKLSELQQFSLSLEEASDSEDEADDDHDPFETETQHQTGCIVIWPTTTADSIKSHEPVRNMKKCWKQIKEFFRSMPCARDGDQEGYINGRINVIMGSCFNGDLTEDELLEARDTLMQILAEAPPSTRDDIYKRLRGIFSANPSENFRRTVEDDMKQNLAERSDHLRVWVSISQKCHEYIIEGIGQRLPKLLEELTEKTYPRNVATMEPEANPHRIEMIGYIIQADIDRDPVEVIGSRLGNYLECLLAQADSASLVTQFLEAIEVPATDDSQPRTKHEIKEQPQLYNSLELSRPAPVVRGTELVALLHHVAATVSKLLSSSEVASIDAVSSALLRQFMTFFQKLVQEIYPCERPPDSMPSLSFPPLSKRCKKSACHICPAVNHFLVSPDTETLSLRCPAGFQSHFFQIRKLFPPDGQIVCKWELEGEGRFRGQGKMSWDKNITKKYEDQQKVFAENLTERKKWLEPLGVRLDDHGEILEPTTDSRSKSGTKRKATEDISS
ncbi:hypothetical protein Dda_6626 [Drechslerella dactyloides]|uniref:Uncharacterized protein n=1 Tax=Drechslerella dactyloides TaxID=74499 RepID=A0AAD6NHK5_DREDA|nr:hypothetical protein Dda_6626 [Drechslerella dactyloides]